MPVPADPVRESFAEKGSDPVPGALSQASAITREGGTFSYSLIPTNTMEHPSSVASASAVCSSITTVGSHEFLYHSRSCRWIEARVVDLIREITNGAVGISFGLSPDWRVLV